jgi:type IV secretion system protein VirD4
MNAATDMAQLTGIGNPDTVLELKPDEMLLQLAGDSAVVARLPDYLRDPPFAGAFDANPYYENERAIMATPVPSIQLRPPDASPATPPPRAPRASGPDPLHDRLLALWA